MAGTPEGSGVTKNAVINLHGRLRKAHPPSGVCEECGAEGPTEYAFKRHPESHTDRREDYRELCRECHAAFDRWLYEMFPGGVLRPSPSVVLTCPCHGEPWYVRSTTGERACAVKRREYRARRKVAA